MGIQMSLAILLVLSVAISARGDIMIVPGPGNVAGDENILFNEAGLVGTGNPVEGVTNNTSFVVDFLGSETLTTLSGGQARVEAKDGTFDELSIALEAIEGVFTSLIFNVNAADDGQITIQVIENNAAETFGTFDIDRSGENFFVISAINNQLISSVHLTSTVPLDDIRQIRMGGVGVPEPSTLPLAAGAIAFGLAWPLRRRIIR